MTPQWMAAAEEQAPGVAPPLWAPWAFKLPQLPGQPGDAATTDTDALVGAMAKSLQALLDEQLDPVLAAQLNYRPALNQLHQLASSSTLPNDPIDGIDDTRAKLQTAAGRVRAHVVLLAGRPNGTGGAISASTATQFPDPLARILILADLALSAGIGWALDLCARGPSAYDTLNEQDFRDWLHRHGATHIKLRSVD